MIPNSFRAFEVSLDSSQKATTKIKDLPSDCLKEGNVFISVHYSSLNYKDYLCSSGYPGIAKQYPFVPGIDAAGIVIDSQSDKFNAGDPVIVTGYQLGMKYFGGFGELIRVPEEWIVPLPTGLSLHDTMAIGTAGFTAAQGLQSFQSYFEQPEKRIAITGATGGVGSIATEIFSRKGFEVHAFTGKTEQTEALKELGAHAIHPRLDSTDQKSPLLKGQWDFALDTIGGPTLSTLIRSIRYRGQVACCGMIDDPNLNVSLMPFLLRGLRLVGLDSASCPMEARLEIWKLLSHSWKPTTCIQNVKTIPLNDLPAALDLMSKGSLNRRIVIQHESSKN